MIGLRVLLFPDRVAIRTGLVASAIYALAYLYSVGSIVVAPGSDLVGGAPVPSAVIVPEWTTRMWKPIAPFVWEPIAAVYPLRWLALYLSVPNLLLTLLLAGLVGLNVMVVLARMRLVRTAGGEVRPLKGLLGAAPGLLTGFTCCVPTLVLALGSLAAGFTVAVIAVRPYFIPAAVIALIVNALWGLRQVSCPTHAGRAPSAS